MICDSGTYSVKKTHKVGLHWIKKDHPGITLPKHSYDAMTLQLASLAYIMVSKGMKPSDKVVCISHALFRGTFPKDKKKEKVDVKHIITCIPGDILDKVTNLYNLVQKVTKGGKTLGEASVGATQFHRQTTHKTSTKKAKPKRAVRTCSTCGEPGHDKRRCPKSATKHKKKPPEKSSDSSDEDSSEGESSDSSESSEGESSDSSESSEGESSDSSESSEGESIAAIRNGSRSGEKDVPTIPPDSIQLEKPPRRLRKNQVILYKWDPPHGWTLGIIQQAYTRSKKYTSTKYTHWVHYPKDNETWPHRLTPDGYGTRWIALKKKYK